jgi:ubiquinone/menaquinone biosynthesis C-methylase UbiE
MRIRSVKKDEIDIAGGDTATPLNLAKRLRVVEPYLFPTSVVLDAGCGEGDYVVALREIYGLTAYGIEFIEEKVEAFASARPESKWVRRGDLQALPYASETFDLVLLNEVLEHVPDESAALAEVRRVLKVGATLIVFSPNRLYPFESHGVYSRRSGAKIPPYVPFVPYVPVRIGRKVFRYWARNYWPGQLARLLRDAGFDPIRRTYVWQTFENISGSQPGLIRRFSRVLRAVASGLERTPLVKSFGISQVLVARKAE